MITPTINSLTGLWLIIAPAALGYGDPSATLDRIIGPIIVAIALIAMREATRKVQYLNIMLGLVLLILPWFLSATGIALVAQVVTAVLIVVFSWFAEKPRHTYGGGWKALGASDQPEQQENIPG